MVSELPGSYYKTLKLPDKKMLCGLIENTLGWHIDLADRKKIFDEMSKLRKKQIKQKTGQTKSLFDSDEITIQHTDYSKGSTFLPLLMDYFNIQEVKPIMTKVLFYDDLWNKAYRRADAVVHPKGTCNISYDLLVDKRMLKRSNKNPKQVDDKALEEFFKNNIENFPLYYSTPTTREYISMVGKYEVQMTIDADLKAMLQENVLAKNIGYLGNSEGWVNLKFKDL
jgi:CRISPR-associated protein Cas5